jgi:hypothetical protein
MAKTEATTETLHMLRQQYGMLIPLDVLQHDFFKHLSVEKLKRKIRTGEIPLPIVRMATSSQKTAQAVPTSDFAVHLDKLIEAARKECRQLSGSAAS